MNKFKNSSEITEEYYNNIQSLNPNVNPRIQATDWYVKANIQGGVISGVYQNAYNLQQAVFVQNASGSTLDYYLSTYNLTPRLAATPATGTMLLTTPLTGSNTLQMLSGDQLNLNNSNIIYIVTTNILLTASNYTTTPVQIESATTGSGTGLTAGTVLNITKTSIQYAFSVQTMNDGANIEYDSSVRYRILAAKRAPKTGGSQTDYYNWCISQPNINNVYLLVANILSKNYLNLYLMSGNADIDSILTNVAFGNYSRTATAIDIANCSNYVESVRPTFDQLFFSTVETYIVNSTLSFNIINVSLIPNVSLTTVLPGNTLSVAQLLARELRRGILSTPLAGTTLLDGNQYIILSYLQNVIYDGLNATNGIYAQVVIDFDLNFNNSTNNIVVPNTFDPLTLQYPAVYDINSANINISTA